jgi:regulator of RNase E activity RraA
LGALLGEVHFNIQRALGCVGIVTNGAVRSLPTAEALGVQVFAGNVSVSHAYTHIVEFGTPVEVDGLTIHSGELLHGDQHGVQSIPVSIAGQLPAVAARIAAKKQAIIALCQSPEFSLEKLRAALAGETDSTTPH